MSLDRLESTATHIVRSGLLPSNSFDVTLRSDKNVSASWKLITFDVIIGIRESVSAPRQVRRFYVMVGKTSTGVKL